MVDGIKSYRQAGISLRKRVADVLGVSLDGAEEEESQPVEVSKQSAFAILVVDSLKW